MHVSLLALFGNLDRYIFLLLNRQWTHPLLDAVLPVYRDQDFWLPVYLFMLVLVLYNFGGRAWAWVLFAVITVVLTDQTSSTLVKYMFAEQRPCQDPEMAGYARLLLNYCPGNPGFTSSHAANHFGFSTFIFVTLGYLMPRWRYVFLLWALSICYAQVYVGVHYPSDVLGGALLGILIGIFTARTYNRLSFSIVKTHPHG